MRGSTAQRDDGDEINCYGEVGGQVENKATNDSTISSKSILS